ncbi:MAG: PIN domain-containing protein [Blastocatellales bacterium]|nr:PIN domain-containing protein [Blastocatellales bacterium]
MIKIDDALSGVVRLGLDTAPIIYFIEANPGYDGLVTEIFQRVNQGAPKGVTSVITLSEVLVQPIRQQNLPLQQEYRDLLLTSQNLQTYEISAAIAESAAILRVRYRLRTPDALQIATALDTGCEAFLCNDTGLRRVTELRILVLDDLEL